MATIAYLESVLADEHKIMGIAKDDFLDVKNASVIPAAPPLCPMLVKIDAEDLIAEKILSSPSATRAISSVRL